MNKLFLILVMAVSTVFGQEIAVKGPSNMPQDGTLTLRLNTTATTAVGLQWTLSPPTGWTIGVTTKNDLVVGKTLVCGAVCLLYGLNVTLIPAGDIASVTVTPPAGFVGVASFTIVNQLGATADAQPITLTVFGKSVSVLSSAQFTRWDLDGDHEITSADLTLAIEKIKSHEVCADCYSGFWDVVEGQKIYLAIFGAF